MFETRIKLQRPPRKFLDGQVVCALPSSYVDKDHELAITMAFICNRELFGWVYRGIQLEYFWNMPAESGVVVRPIVPTHEIVDGALKPGDIDLLIIPYEEDALVVSRTIVMEIKIVRASYAKQGKSPNDFGASQVGCLMEHKFPYAVLCHLVVADQSPEDAWREMGRARILDSYGRISFMKPEKTDRLPAELIDRAFGRLEKLEGIKNAGLVAAYVERQQAVPPFPKSSIWIPSCRPPVKQEDCSALYRSIHSYYERERSSFIDMPRWPDPKHRNKVGG